MTAHAKDLHRAPVGATPDPLPNLAEAGWLLAQCRAGHEHIVAEQARSRDLAQVFLPRETRRRRWRGRWQDLLQPVFQGYVFLAPHPGFRNWRAVHNLRGLTRIVGFGDRGPARVPGALVAAIRARCDSRGILQTREALQPGQAVRVLTGPFADLVTRIEALDPQQRAVLLIDLMGRKVRTVVDPQDLRPLSG